MKLQLSLAFVLLSLVGAVALLTQGAKKIYPDRWVYVSRGLHNDKDVEDIRQIVKTAADHGLNGVLLSAGLDRIDIQPPDYLRRLREVKQICENKVELIPAGFSLGYGGTLLAHNKNLAAGMPVKGALFIAGRDEAHFQSDSPLPAGKIENTAGHAVLTQTIDVTPYRSYHVHVLAKAERGAPSRLFVRAFAPDGRNLSYREPDVQDGRADVGFNSWYANKVRLTIGAEEDSGSKATILGATIQEVGLVNVIRRPGTPVVVRSEKDGTVYEEGRDYAPISDPRLDFEWSHESPVIRLLPGSRIHEGDRLRVDYYHGNTIYRDQVVADMSEPEVYDIWRRQFPIIQKELSPKRYFLSMDEVRCGNFCEACQRRHIEPAQMIGDTITRLYKMAREVSPGAEVWVWSDMLDPNHNARAKYYLVNGSYVGSWNYIPKDMRIGCWYFEKRRASLDHFSKLGFHTLAGAYYDADDLKNPEGWLEALDATPGATGIMYTTWQNKYALLPAFGDLVSKR